MNMRHNAISSAIVADNMIQAAEPWNTTEAEHYKRTAMQCLRHDYNHTKADPLNCGGCALRIGNGSGPNYAGWQRVYVEAGLVIPRKWKRAFYSAFTGRNQAFALALARSCKTFTPMLG